MCGYEIGVELILIATHHEEYEACGHSRRQHAAHREALEQRSELRCAGADRRQRTLDPAAQAGWRLVTHFRPRQGGPNLAAVPEFGATSRTERQMRFEFVAMLRIDLTVEECMQQEAGLIASHIVCPTT